MLSLQSHSTDGLIESTAIIALDSCINPAEERRPSTNQNSDYVVGEASPLVGLLGT